MFGPARHIRGGISSVVNSYFSSNLTKIYKIHYIATHIDESKFRKLCQFIKAFIISLKNFVSHNAKIVHLHVASRASFYRKSIFIILSKIFGKKTIIHIHGAEFNIFYHAESGFLKQKFIREILLLADFIVVLSEQWKKDLEKIIHDHKNIRVVNNGVILPAYIEKHGKKFIKILFMGRLGRRKGVYDLIETVKKIVKKIPNVRFVIAGDGDVYKVNMLVQEKGLSEYIVIPGWISNKENYYREADIYALPSYNEGLPMSILEACSYGLPVVSTPVGGIPEVIEDGINGFLVQSGDVKVLEERLLRLIESSELRKKMGMAGYEKVRDRFNIDHIADQISKLYEELLHQ